MKKNYLYMAALALLTAACSNEDEFMQEGNMPTPGVNMITETITATNGDASTRADVADDATFSWTAGDNIAVHVSNGTTHKYVSTADEGASGADQSAAEASFTVAYEEGYSRDAFAVFPASIVAESAENYGQEGHALDVTLPSSYTLAEVSGTKTPCPMIADNTSGNSWEFKQLCGLLRLTVSDIPSTAKRLEIDFDGKKVCGDFSIASAVTPGTSVIVTTDDADHDIITITKDGTNAVLGSTELALNIPLPVGAYANITVVAYDALTGGSALKFGNTTFSYTANRARGKKTAVAVTSTSFTFTFRNADTQANLGNNLRFVRIFSYQDKLYNGTTTYGPFTVSSATDMDNPVSTTLKFASVENDQLIFQVITSDGKVYSGSFDTPTGGFTMGAYDLTVDVKAYTFTVKEGKSVCFSPGDLGYDNGVYHFIEPFADWGKSSTKKSYFNFSEAKTDKTVYGITWNIVDKYGYNEWGYIVGTRSMNSGVSRSYRVNIGNDLHYVCLLLPPDEATSTDLGTDLTAASPTIKQVGKNDYLKYLAKGFVLLAETNKYDNGSLKTSDTYVHGGYYWTNQSKCPFYFNSTTAPKIQMNFAKDTDLLHARYYKVLPSE